MSLPSNINCSASGQPDDTGTTCGEYNDITNIADVTHWQNEEQRFQGLLIEYKNSLCKWLNNAKTFSQFTQRITEELKQYGLAGWSFTRLDIPDCLAISECVGTLSRDDIDEYLSKHYHESDLMRQHARHSDQPVYQSQIEDHVRSAPISTQALDQYLRMLSMSKQRGYMDTYGIPIVDPQEKGRVLFNINSKGMDAFDFYDRTQANVESLKMLGQVIHDVGCLKHPKYFLDTKIRYTKLIMSQPFNLLATMVKYDINVEDGAKRLGIPASTATKHLIKIRNSVDAATNHGAYNQIVQQGIIPVTF